MKLLSSRQSSQSIILILSIILITLFIISAVEGRSKNGKNSTKKSKDDLNGKKEDVGWPDADADETPKKRKQKPKPDMDEMESNSEGGEHHRDRGKPVAMGEEGEDEEEESPSIPEVSGPQPVPTDKPTTQEPTTTKEPATTTEEPTTTPKPTTTTEPTTTEEPTTTQPPTTPLTYAKLMEDDLKGIETADRAPTHNPEEEAEKRKKIEAKKEPQKFPGLSSGKRKSKQWPPMSEIAKKHALSASEYDELSNQFKEWFILVSDEALTQEELDRRNRLVFHMKKIAGWIEWIYTVTFESEKEIEDKDVPDSPSKKKGSWMYLLGRR